MLLFLPCDSENHRPLDTNTHFSSFFLINLQVHLHILSQKEGSLLSSKINSDHSLIDVVYAQLALFFTPLWFSPLILPILSTQISPILNKRVSLYSMPASFSNSLPHYGSTNHIFHLLKLYNSIVVSLFTQLLKRHQNLISENFYQTSKNFLLIPTPRCRQSIIYFLSVWICLKQIFI